MSDDRTNKTPDGKWSRTGRASAAHWANRSGRAATLSQIRNFKLLGDPENDRLVLPVPDEVLRAAEFIEITAVIAFGHVVQWGLKRGLDRLNALPRVQSIRAAQRTLVDLGDASLDRWTYRPRSGTERIFLKAVNPADLGLSKRMAKASVSRPGRWRRGRDDRTV
jgi:hypothetical protein